MDFKILLRVAFSWQTVAFEARLDSYVVHHVATASTLNGKCGGLRLDGRGCNHDARDLHQLRHLV